MSYFVYMVGILLHAIGQIDLQTFGSTWLQGGFCVSHKGTLYDSHMLCFYIDTIFSCWLLWISWDKDPMHPALYIVRHSVGFTFMHGLGHLGLWVSQDLLKPSETPWQVMDTITGIQGLAQNAAFFFTAFTLQPSFLQSFCTFHHLGAKKSVCLSILQSVAYGTIGIVLVPQVYNFAYVQAVVTMQGVAVQMVYREKDYYYDLFAVLVNIPINGNTWLEPLLCEALLARWGGHLWFDVAIPVGLLTYCYIVRHHIGESRSKNKEESMTQKTERMSGDGLAIPWKCGSVGSGLKRRSRQHVQFPEEPALVPERRVRPRPEKSMSSLISKLFQY